MQTKKELVEGVVVLGGNGVIGSEICKLLNKRKKPTIATYCHREPEANSHYKYIKNIRYDMFKDDVDHSLFSFAEKEDIEIKGLVVSMYSKDKGVSLLKNLEARICVTDKFAKYMMSRKGGSIVLMSSSAGQLPINHNTSRFYAAENGYLDGYVRGASGNFAPNVRINAVAPGIVEQQNSLAGSLHEKFNPSRIPLGRFQTAEGVAKTVLFLLFGNIDITGQVINVDGGLTSSMIL